MTSLDTPLITVILCTNNRPHSFRRAFDSVLLQDVKDSEIIVVDDGNNEPVEIPSVGSDWIRVIRTKHRGIGGARFEALNAARGEFIAYCDDDHVWKPNHSSSLLAYLLENDHVDLVYGDSEWLQDGALSTVAYSVDYDGFLLSQMNYIFASDVMHRTSSARDAGGFDSTLRAHEDWDLWLRMSHKCTLRHIPVVIGSHHWNENSVSEADFWDDWRRVYENHQRRLNTAGAEARHDLDLTAFHVRPFEHTSWHPERRQLVWHSMLRSAEGYGSAGRQLLLALERHGVEITMAPTKNQPVRGFERFYKPITRWGRFGFYYDYRVQPSVLKCERTINYSMWESTVVPKAHVEEINRSAALQYVPCAQNVESFQASGVRVPIKVLHHGVDANQFPRLDRHHSEFFTFGTFGDLSPRKGVDVLIRSFRDEFHLGEPVRLLLKTNGSTAPLRHIDDPRISVFSGRMEPQRLLEFLRQMDAFVLASRGEGFGLCGLEAMATGLPLIATNWSGPAEYLTAEYSYPLSYRLVDAQGIESNHVRYFGLWAEPEYEHLRYLMRWVYEHPSEAREKGRIAAQRVGERWTWDRVAGQLCDDLNAIASE